MMKPEVRDHATLRVTTTQGGVSKPVSPPEKEGWRAAPGVVDKMH